MNNVTFPMVTESFISFYRFYHQTALFTATFSIAILVFVIMKASTKNMGTYKWLLLNEAMWNFGMELAFSGYQFVTTFPIPCAFSAAPMFRQTGNYVSSQFMFMFLVICIIGKVHSMFITFLNCLVFALSYNDDLFQLYNAATPWLQLFLLFFFAGIIIPNVYVFKAYLNSSKQLIIDEPTTFCFFDDDKDKIITLLFVVVTFLTLTCFSMLLLGNYIIRINEKQLVPSTFRLQWILFKSCVLQFAAAFFWLIIPFYLFVISVIFDFNYRNNIVCISICMATAHSFIDSLIVLWFIRPYRDFVSSTFGLTRKAYWSDFNERDKLN